MARLRVGRWGDKGGREGRSDMLKSQARQTWLMEGYRDSEITPASNKRKREKMEEQRRPQH